jgi:hypothetical protein
LASKIQLKLFQGGEIEFSEGDQLCAGLRFEIGTAQQEICNRIRPQMQLRSLRIGERFAHHHTFVQIGAWRISISAELGLNHSEYFRNDWT